MAHEQALHLEIVKSLLHGDEGVVSCRTCCVTNCETFYNASDEIFIDSEHYQGVFKVSTLFKSVMNLEVDFGEEPDSFCPDCVDTLTKSYIFQTKCRKIETLRVEYLKLLLEYVDNSETQAHMLSSDVSEMYVYIGEPEFPLKEYDETCLEESTEAIETQLIEIKNELEVEKPKRIPINVDCDYCGANFKSKYGFIAHLKKSCLQGDRLAIKKYVRQVFPKEAIIKPDFTCLICRKYYSCRLSLVGHLKKKCLKDNPQDIEEYAEKFLPIASEKKREFYCPLCKKYYSSRNSLYLHLRNKCMVNKDTETVIRYFKSIYRSPSKLTGSAKCLLCGNFYATRRTVLSHLKGNCMKNASDESIKEFFDQHYPMEKSDKFYICFYCGKGTKTEAGYIEHSTACSARQNPDLKSDQFCCSECDAVFYLKRSLRSHIARCHRDENLPCPECGKTFKTKMYLRNHMIVHTRERRHQCDVCQNKFINRDAMIIHRRIHTGERPFACEVCEEKFISKSRRTEHMKRKHWEPQYNCELCPKSFVTGYSLRKHLETHSGGKLKISDFDIKYETEETVIMEEV